MVQLLTPYIDLESSQYLPQKFLNLGMACGYIMYPTSYSYAIYYWDVWIFWTKLQYTVVQPSTSTLSPDIVENLRPIL